MPDLHCFCLNLDQGMSEYKTLFEKTNCAIVLDVTGFGVFEQGWALRGFEDFLVDMAAEPKFAEALIQVVADYQVALYDHVLAEIGPYIQVVMVSDDLGTQHGPMISLESYRRLVKPAQKRVWQFIKSKTAARLFLSEKTVKNHISSIFLKLQVNDRTEAALLAAKYGVTERQGPEAGGQGPGTARRA
jgi:hypothetical protein